jgi:hypothetical protein
MIGLTRTVTFFKSDLPLSFVEEAIEIFKKKFRGTSLIIMN